jgi:hypothetical protein
MNQQTLGNQQLNLAGQQQQFLGQDVGALSTLGAQNQALQQAQFGAQQQLAQQQLQQPLTAAQCLWSRCYKFDSWIPRSTNSSYCT